MGLGVLRCVLSLDLFVYLGASSEIPFFEVDLSSRFASASLHNFEIDRQEGRVSAQNVHQAVNRTHSTWN